MIVKLQVSDTIGIVLKNVLAGDDFEMIIVKILGEINVLLPLNLLFKRFGHWPSSVYIYMLRTLRDQQEYLQK